MQGYILGLSFSQGSDIGSFGILKVAGVEKPNDSAIRDLWKNYEEEHGKIEGKKVGNGHCVAPSGSRRKTIDEMIVTSGALFWFSISLVRCTTCAPAARPLSKSTSSTVLRGAS